MIKNKQISRKEVQLSLGNLVLVQFMLVFIIACETTAPPENMMDMAGESMAGESMAGESMAGESMAGESMAGESMAGESMAGESMAGESMAGVIIEQGGSEAGSEIETPSFDPSTPLPEPMATSLAPPVQIAESGTGEVDASCQGNYFNEVRGWVVDELGEPVVGARVQLCVRDYETSTLACLSPQITQAGGYYQVPVTESTRCMLSATLRTIVPRVAYAPMYCHGSFESDMGDGVLRLTEPLVLYQTRPATQITEASNEGENAQLSFLGDLELSFVAESLYGPTLDELGARPVSPNAPGLCFLEEGEDAPQIDGIFAFAPEGDFSRDTAQVSFSNTMGYEPGQEIQLYVLGSLDCSIEGQTEPLEEGDWVAVTTATVDEAGILVTTELGAGIPCLSWLGYGPIR